MAMGHIENGSAELQDKLEPLDEDLKTENFGPSLDEDGIILPVTSFSTLFKKRAGTFLSHSYFACLFFQSPLSLHSSRKKKVLSSLVLILLVC